MCILRIHASPQSYTLLYVIRNPCINTLHSCVTTFLKNISTLFCLFCCCLASGVFHLCSSGRKTAQDKDETTDQRTRKWEAQSCSGNIMTLVSFILRWKTALGKKWRSKDPIGSHLWLPMVTTNFKSLTHIQYVDSHFNNWKQKRILVFRCCTSTQVFIIKCDITELCCSFWTLPSRPLTSKINVLNLCLI